MPPWHADPQYGHFVNDRSLSPRTGDAAGLGRPGHPARRHQGHAAGPQVPRGLDDRQARRGLRDPRDVLRAGAGRRGLRPLRRADELQGRHVGPGGGGGPGEPSVVHHIVVYVMVNRRADRGGGPASTSAAMPRATCPRSCPRARPSESPRARTSSSRSTTRPTAGSEPTGRGSG